MTQFELEKIDTRPMLFHLFMAFFFLAPSYKIFGRGARNSGIKVATENDEIEAFLRPRRRNTSYFPKTLPSPIS